jgi:Tfp pilus assembly protein PilX
MASAPRTPRRQRRDRHDDGSVIVIAIAMVTIVGLIVVSALAYSVASLRASTKVYAPKRAQLYLADAATKQAIAYVGNHPELFPYKGPAPTGCYDLTYAASTTYGTVTTKVCPNSSNTFIPSASNQFSVITLGTGTTFQLKSNGTMNVKGNVYANGAITTGPGTLAVTSGVVKATGGCSGTITVDGTTISNCTVVSLPAAAADPLWTTGISVKPLAGTWSCATVGGKKVATLTPGSWSSADMNTATSSCNDLILLAPGAYYIDFAWSITTKVIAGTLADTVANTLASGKNSGECDKTKPGAMIVLGGSGAITTQKGDLQVCGLSTTQGSSTVKIPIFGLTAATEVTVSGGGSLAATADPTNGSGGINWTNLPSARTVDGTLLASVSLTASKVSSPANFSYTPAATVVGGKLLSADVWLKNSSTTLPATFQITVTSGAKTCTVPATAATISTLTLTKFNVDLSGATCPTPTASTQIKVALKVTASSATGVRLISVDGITLNYSTFAATMPRLTSATVLTSSGNSNYFWLDGYVYVPSANVDVQTPNSAGLVITLGIVANAITVNPTGSSILPPDIGQDQVVGITTGEVLISSRVGTTKWVDSLVSYDKTSGTMKSTTETWLVYR